MNGWGVPVHSKHERAKRIFRLEATTLVRGTGVTGRFGGGVLGTHQALGGLTWAETPGRVTLIRSGKRCVSDSTENGNRQCAKSRGLLDRTMLSRGKGPPRWKITGREKREMAATKLNKCFLWAK